MFRRSLTIPIGLGVAAAALAGNPAAAHLQAAAAPPARADSNTFHPVTGDGNGDGTDTIGAAC